MEKRNLLPFIIRELVWSIVVGGGIAFLFASPAVRTGLIMPKAVGFVAFVVLFTFAGCFIANLLRLWVHPDFVVTSGFIGMLKAKVFWRIGPQFIGSIIGIVAGIKLGMAVFGIVTS